MKRYKEVRKKKYVRLAKYQLTLLLLLLQEYIKGQKESIAELKRQEDEDLDGAWWAFNDPYCIPEGNIEDAEYMLRQFQKIASWKGEVKKIRFVLR